MLGKTVSWTILVLLLTSASALVFNTQLVRAEPETIYVRADGSIDPSTAPISTVDNVTYTLTGSIYDSIVVERDNTVIDGSGYTVTGTNAYDSRGIDLTGRSNVTVKNMTVEAFYYGVYLNSSSGNILGGNNVTTHNRYGIRLDNSSNNVVGGNTVANNYDSIYLRYSSGNSIIGNTVENNMDGIMLDSSNSNNITGNSVTANNIYGIRLYSSSYNSLSENNITANIIDGITLEYSSNNNNVSGNTLADNADGLWLYSSSNNNIVIGNNVTANNGYGILLSSSSNNDISENNVTANNQEGIELSSFSNNNTVTGNNVVSNQCGISVYYSSDNSVYHNNFVNNTRQVSSPASTSVWDDGYPSGGNYWSDYNGTDANHDGIGDTPYTIDVNNTDHYPLMNLYVIPEFPSFLIPPLFMLATLMVAILCRRRAKTR